MYIIKEYEAKYNKKVNNFIISILVEEYGFEKYRESLENENNNDIYQNKNKKFWIAIDEEDNIIGTVLIYENYEKCMELRKFYVRKDFRGRGLAKELYNTVIDFCENSGVEKIFIGTNKNLDRAINFYLKQGFYEIKYDDKKNPDNRYFEKQI